MKICSLSSFNFGVLTFVLFISYACFAESYEDRRYKGDDRLYESAYYKSTGFLNAKVRGFYQYFNGQQKFDGQVNKNVDPLMQYNYGGEASVAYFFTPNIAAEATFGLGYHNVDEARLGEIIREYAAADTTVEAGDDIIWQPHIYTLAQYHIAPYGSIKPYVGAGMFINYYYAQSDKFEVSPHAGFVAQLGVDLVGKDNSIFTFDLKYLHGSSNVTYLKNFLNREDGSEETSSVTWNPFKFSAGVGLHF